MFGIAYMFVHDGLVHRRFPVGPIADVPYLQKVAAAHQVREGAHGFARMFSIDRYAFSRAVAMSVMVLRLSVT